MIMHTADIVEIKCCYGCCSVGCAATLPECQASSGQWRRCVLVGPCPGWAGLGGSPAGYRGIPDDRRLVGWVGWLVINISHRVSKCMAGRAVLLVLASGGLYGAVPVVAGVLCRPVCPARWLTASPRSPDVD